ncbi:MAG: DUF4147 domain-containing protein [Balneolaceae bacterium]|nr:DUF4147 domain-containing protein [Balneolaceae bacterium]
MNTLAQEVFEQALETNRPENVLRNAFQDNAIVTGEPDQALRLELDRYPDIYVAGSGKAAWEMVTTLSDLLGERLSGALAISSYETGGDHPKIAFHRAAHPVPDATSRQAGEKLIRFVRDVPAGTLLLYAISGGTSSLVCKPAGEITIEELNHTFELLNTSGANIREINTVRKHLSAIKGGQLLRHIDPSVTLLDLVISDVPDDDMQIIGSGPSTPDSSTFQDAYHVLLEYQLWEKLPASVKKQVEEGIDGIAPETVKPGNDPLADHHSLIVGSAKKLAETAAELLEEAGYNCWVADRAYNRDVGEVARTIADKVIAVDEKQSPVPLPVAFVFFGESTVDVRGSGKGGRNQELALRGALEIQGYDNITWLSAGTDGIDGPTDAAGAIVSGKTIAEAHDRGMDPGEYLRNNDSYHFHERMGTLLKTGPTGNNLMDLQIVIVD